MRLHTVFACTRACKPRALPAAALLLAACWTPALAQHSAEQVLSAVVGVRAQVPDDARTANSLGTARLGSGVLIDTTGLVATIGYLILEASKVEIIRADGRVLPASILGYDHDTGFGLLRAIGEVGARPLRLGDSAELDEGTPVLAASFGGPRAVRPAAVVSRREFAGYWEYLLPDAIFTSPPHPAYGGAALLDGEGRLLGIGSLVVSDASPGEAVPGNMFVPVNALKAVIGELLTTGRSATPRRPWLGVFVEESRNKVFVANVAPDGPAERAGVTAGDIIVKVRGQSVASVADFYRKVWALGEAGVSVPLTLLSGSDLLELEVRSGDRYAWLRLVPAH